MRPTSFGPAGRASRLFRCLRFLPLCVAFGCSSSTADIGGALSIELTVDRTSGVAGVDPFTFRYDAVGSDLMGIVLEFGDGQADSLGTQGSTRAGATRVHTYEVPGTYSAVARVLESHGAVLADTVVVEVQDP